MSVRKSGAKALLLTLLIVSFGTAYSQENSFLRKMKFDGSLKTKYEYALETNMSRFSVRNSRLGLSGDMNSYVSYRVQIELSNEGKFEVLDLSATLKPMKNLTVTMGQTSIPIYNSSQITPAQMMFANRTFLAKYFVPGTRDLGVLAAYNFSVSGVPVELDAGAFNASKSNNPVWTDNLSWSARAIIGSMDGFRASAKVYRYPGIDADFFLWGADMRYGKERFKIEAEVLDREDQSTGDNLFSSCLQGGYSFPIKNGGMFKDITPALRWDLMGHKIAVNGIGVNRLTFGLSFGFTSKPFSSLLRIDFEKYFKKNILPEFTRYEEMDSDKITVELQIIF
ncbi:MAG: hypothetical protein LLF93_00510 [Bacteroidales bacterium]|nr:hypothetical protein [Bacteroidales bacterium]